MIDATGKINIHDVLGKLFARTEESKELAIPARDELTHQITNLIPSANALITIAAQEGSGITTYFKTLKQSISQFSDVLIIAPTCEISQPGWLLRSLTPWISSTQGELKDIQKRFADLAESHRPILICVDTSDLIQLSTLVGDVTALLNLSDTCNLNLSIIISGTIPYIQKFNEDKRSINRLILAKELPDFSEKHCREFIDFKLSLLEADGLIRVKPTQDEIDRIIKNSNKTPLNLIKQLSSFLNPSQINKQNILDEKLIKSSIKEKSLSKSPQIADLLAPRKGQG